ncbi:MAG TPA: hydrogenase, partial [Rhodanobacter sp.]
CNVIAIQALWSARVRAHHGWVFAIGLLVLIGMWFERFMLIVSSLYRDFLPSSWGMFYPTLWDLLFLFGSIGLFFLLFLLFVRWLPMVSMAELRKLVHSHEGAPT